MIERLKDFQKKRGEFASGQILSENLKENTSLKNEISFLARVFLHREVSGCINCFMDAYISLMNLKIEKVMAQENQKFLLKAGALLYNKEGKAVTVRTATDDDALFILSNNENFISEFQQKPDNWKTLVAAYKDGTTLSSDATLKSLSISDNDFDSDFATDTLDYTATYAKAPTAMPTIEAEPSDENAKISIGTVSAIPGSTDIVVLAQDGTTSKKYTITFAVDETLSDEESQTFTDAEKAAIADMKTKLAAGTKKPSIWASYMQAGVIGEKKVTAKLINILLKEAEK